MILRHGLLAGSLGISSLVALVIGLAGVLEPASVLDGNLIAGLGRGASAFGVNDLGDTHCDVWYLLVLVVRLGGF